MEFQISAKRPSCYLLPSASTLVATGASVVLGAWRAAWKKKKGLRGNTLRRGPPALGPSPAQSQQVPCPPSELPLAVPEVTPSLAKIRLCKLAHVPAPVGSATGLCPSWVRVVGCCVQARAPLIQGATKLTRFPFFPFVSPFLLSSYKTNNTTTKWTVVCNFRMFQWQRGSGPFPQQNALFSSPNAIPPGSMFGSSTPSTLSALRANSEPTPQINRQPPQRQNWRPQLPLCVRRSPLLPPCVAGLGGRSEVYALGALLGKCWGRVRGVTASQK